MKLPTRHKWTNRQSGCGRRPGFTILELLVAAVILGAAAMICLRMLTAAAHARRASDQQRLAARETANLMERLMAGPRAELAAAAEKPPLLSPEAATALHDAKVELRLAPETDEPEATRITLTLTWRPQTGRPARSAQLVAWRYELEAAKTAPASPLGPSADAPPNRSSELPPTTEEGPRP